ncbi:1-aminocyclopropane-1-carboxylate oxidase isoform X2 [Canna indica]|uniref:1-aminocyclopropane-1-carboxylate oxidase isoform X2 n=1 Tax=Canna indica TaxID=4628 RepID=A0AAQ3JKH7_9LILI|nr:1-aminocyclopropane-1-carboxylate oxidase isoform X2 [Canna indica]
MLPLPHPEFRAPPPSPVAGAHAHMLDPADDDDELAGFLIHSLRVPKLSLPHRIFPQEATPWDPPDVDFRQLISREDDAPEAELLKSAASAFGCFQLVNHGIPPGLIAAVEGAAASAFQLPPGAKKKAARSPDRRCGFELEEEEGVLGEAEEFLWLCPSAMRERKELAAIWPQGCRDLRENLEGLWREIENIASRIEEVLLDNANMNAQLLKSRREEAGDGSSVCFHKHASNGSHSAGIKHELLRMLVRSWSCSCHLSLHLLGSASEFHVYSKRGWYKFCPDTAAIIVTIGDQIQACSGGFYKHVIGKPAVVSKGNRQDSIISMAFHCAHQGIVDSNTSHSLEEKTISLGEQVMIAAFLAIAYYIVTFLCGGSV